MDAKRIVCVFLGLGIGAVACHRPLPELPRIPLYPDRSVGNLTNVDSVLEGYADQVAPAPAADREDLTDGEVRRLALENNPEVLMAKTRLDQARAHLEASKAWPNPQLDGRYLMDPDGRFHSETAFRFVLPLGGRVSASAELAAKELDLARLELLAARRQALSRADRLLARLAHARSRLELLGSLADRSQKYAELARSRRAASMADALDVALVLADARSDARAVQRQRAEVLKIEQRLRLLVGMPPHQGRFMVGSQKLVRLKDSPDLLGEEAASHNISVLRSRLKVLVADRNVVRAAAERVPDLELGPALTSEGDGFALGVSLGMSIPLLNTGRGPYQEALARRRTAEEAYAQSLRAAVGRITTTLSVLDSVHKELDQLRGEAGQELEDAVQLAEVRYTAGKLDVLRLLSVHRAHARLGIEQLGLLMKIHETLIDLREAVGRPVQVEEVSP